MGVFDAPTWILAAWRRSLQDVGATADGSALEAAGERMIERWSAPERIHHNLRRLIGVLARVDELAPETHHPDVVRLAAWYHGAVFNAAALQAYAHRGGVDEPASAELARTELTELGVPADVVERVAALILGIARHSAPRGDIDAQALCDADLGGLAAEPQRYAAYRKEVRAEYAHIPREDYLRARLAIVTKLLGRPYLFQSPMAQDWEDAARENLTAERDRLTVEARRLEAEGAEPAGSGTREQAADGGVQVGSGTSPRVRGTGEQAADGGAQVSPAVAGEGSSAGAGPGASASDGAGGSPDAKDPPAVPEEVDLPDGGPGPSGFEPREAADPGAAAREAGSAGSVNAAGSAGAADSTNAPERADDAAESEGASIESAPVEGRAAEPRTAADDRREDATESPREETVAERSQRRWAEHLAREAADEEAEQRAGTSTGLTRRRGTSARTPVEPGGETGRNESAESAPDDFDETSSLSRPPRMPAVKRRPPAED